MKEYYSIPLKDEEAQVILDITQLIDEPIKPIAFSGDINTALEEFQFDNTATFWYEKNHVVGLFFVNSKLKSLPNNFGDLLYLRFLIIHTSPIQEIPPTFGKLRNLELLSFINEPEFDSIINLDLPDIFQYLYNLNTFNISGNFIVNIPSSFTELKNLEDLSLEFCQIFTNYPNFLQYIQKTILASDFYSINELPSNIGSIKTLKRITLKDLNNINLPSSIVKLPSLNELGLIGIKEIINFETIFKIKTLERLNLKDCEIDFIPKSLGDLINLKHLNLSHNNLTEIPSEIKNCQKLEKVDLTWNMFKKELKELRYLRNLKFISYDKAYPEIIPKDLFDKKDLKIV